MLVQVTWMSLFIEVSFTCRVVVWYECELFCGDFLSYQMMFIIKHIITTSIVQPLIFWRLFQCIAATTTQQCPPIVIHKHRIFKIWMISFHIMNWIFRNREKIIKFSHVLCMKEKSIHKNKTVYPSKYLEGKHFIVPYLLKS